jgi:hypothetical protein
MSTQRLVCRLQCMSYKNRAGEREPLSGRMSLKERFAPAPFARFHRALADGITAPPERLATIPARVATNSLQKDIHSVRLVRHDYFPQGSTAYRSSLSPISFLPGSALVHPTLPQAPAGTRLWAERYDGKRDLHFKHAA